MLNKIFRDNEVDCIIVSDPYNMRYISGFSGGEGYVYISPQKRVIITDSRYTESAGLEKKDRFEVVTTSAAKPDCYYISELISSDKAETVGFEERHLTCHAFSYLNSNCGFKNVKPMGEALDDLRVIKSPDELEKMRVAESIGDKAFSDILKFIKAGVTELEVAAELEYSMKKNGAERLSFDTIAASGLNGACPHAVPSSKKLESGDFLTMDFGCVYKGYCSDMTRTVVIGKASDRQKEVYNTVLKAQLTALESIHSGVIGADIHNIAAKVISDAGFGEYFGHGLGHSVGLFIHENPRFSPIEKKKIMAGTIETVEPGIYIPGFGGVRIEDMGVVTEDGYEIFSKSPKELIEII